MLEREKVHPARLGYDRPSPKLLAFLKKHFGLVSYIPQSNNFVVYNEYFSSASSKPLPIHSAPSVPVISTMPKEEAKVKAPAPLPVRPIQRETVKEPRLCEAKRSVPASESKPTRSHPDERQVAMSYFSIRAMCGRKKIGRTEDELRQLQERIKELAKADGKHTGVTTTTTSSEYGSHYSFASPSAKHY